LKSFLLSLIQKEGKEVDHINIIFCDDTYLININKEYLKHDTYTDIITFELSLNNAPILSDIYISIERVKENARSYDSSFTKELHRVIFHGCLHLCGYKDKKNEEELKMREKENLYLNQYLVPRGTKP
jgi:rRNA maturation RNase YbeY